MTAYVVSRVKIADAEAMRRYVAEAPATIEAFGGRYLYRGSEVTALEGTWDADRMVVVEFPTRQAARDWYDSPAYRPLRELRRGASEAVILLAGAQAGTEPADG